LEREIDQLFANYFSDFRNLDLKAIVSFSHHPCTFIVPQGVSDSIGKVYFSISAEQ